MKWQWHDQPGLGRVRKKIGGIALEVPQFIVSLGRAKLYKKIKQLQQRQQKQKAVKVEAQPQTAR